jgi:hypothetical protein
MDSDAVRRALIDFKRHNAELLRALERLLDLLPSVSPTVLPPLRQSPQTLSPVPDGGRHFQHGRAPHTGFSDGGRTFQHGQRPGMGDYGT